MKDHRDIFNSIISYSVKTKLATGKRHINLQTYRHLFNRESLSEFLWDAHKELCEGEQLFWSNLKAEKREGGLRIQVLTSGRKKRIAHTFDLNTDHDLLKKENCLKEKN